jgi:hypothetical protein
VLKDSTIILLPLGFITQHLIGLVDLLKLLFSFLQVLGIMIGMADGSHSSKGSLDLLLAGIWFET